MATALVTAVAGLSVAAAVLAGPAPVSAAPPEPCAQAPQWERDAQALADELAGVPGADEEVLRQELADAGFVPGGDATAGRTVPEAGGWPDLVVDLLVAVLAALDTDGDGEVPVTVLGPAAC